MPFVTRDDIRTEQDELAARAARLQTALDRTHAILDVLVDDIDDKARHDVATLQATLATALGWVTDRARTLDGIARRVEQEIADGIVDEATGAPVRAADIRNNRRS